jgi:spore maturation protein CgeB
LKRMRVLCVCSRYNYGDPRRGESYEYANFIPALRRLGHHVQFFDNWDRSCCHDFRELNVAFLDAIEQGAPEVVLAFQIHYEIWSETWALVRDAGRAATVNWTTDDTWKYPQFSRFLAPFFHAFTTTYPRCYEQYHRDGFTNVLLTQWAVNADNLCSPTAATECEYAVSFVGTAHGERRVWIDALRDRGIQVECFGHGWERGAVPAADIPEIIRKSLINLNFANGAPILDGFRMRTTNQIKARTFEVPGSGGFLLSEWADGLDKYYVPGREIAVFHDLDELTERIRYYLAHPVERDKIAAAGYARTCSEHTYDHRLTQVLDFAIGQRDQRFAFSGTVPSEVMSRDKLQAAIRRHRMTPLQMLGKRGLTELCSVVWGPVRGPRAARRLVFELSWRIAGTHTYSAAGWPGRMFYEVS